MQKTTGRDLPHRKISETFLDFAAPILKHMPTKVKAGEIENVLRIAYVVWNGMAFDEVKGGDGYLAKVRARMAGNPHGTSLIEEKGEEGRQDVGDGKD